MPPRTDSERIAVIEEVVMRMDRRLFGRDGDMGEIQHLDSRITKLENWRWWVVGMALGLGFAAGGFGKQLIETLTK